MLAPGQEDPVSSFHFSCEVEAAFGDLDGMGHVNNLVYLRWMESARIAYWLRVTGQKTHAGLPRPGGASHEPGPGVMSGALIDMILARTEIDYRSPVSYGEKLTVFLRTSLIRRSSLVFEYRLQSRADDRVVAEGRTVVVCYDYAFMRTKPVSPELRERILALDPEARVEI